MKNIQFIRCLIVPESGLAIRLWTTLQPFLNEIGFLCEVYEVSPTGTREKRWRNKPKCLTPKEISEDLAANPEDGFYLEADNRPIPDHRLSFSTSLMHDFTNMFMVGGRDEGHCLVGKHGKELLNLVGSICQIKRAWINLNAYEAWMMCSDIERYATKYGDTSSFSLRKRSFPPNDNLVLDTSSNPGRYEICNGHVWAVAADMWLGPTFWPEAACTPEEVRAQPWLKIEETEHYMHINCWPEPFTRPDGEQGELQKKLWRLLFKSDCEWPPNGGVPQPVPLPEPPPKPTVTMRVDFS